MPRTLIVYGTTDGHTTKVAETMAEQLRSHGHTVIVVDSARGKPDPARFDAIVVSASLHAGGYQRQIVGWVRKHSATLNRMPTAFVSVCLGILQHDPKVDRELKAIMDATLRSTCWQPLETKIVAGALKYTKYNILKRWVMKRIVKKAGGDMDTSKDYEYTDWNALRRFADDFSNLVESNAKTKTA
jgi:menaquinone-dependent protoporphyrinogen oxidase